MATDNPEHKEQDGAADWAFVGFIVLITVIATMLVLIQIYMQNPK
jgi:hypothetical protein